MVVAAANSNRRKRIIISDKQTLWETKIPHRMVVGIRIKQVVLDSV